ncbi:hypothetical protein KBD75_04035 [Candidatus Woesebacteria bacterium]|nr:hypothetical protein [Candidatus Woesebacteria bacterium]
MKKYSLLLVAIALLITPLIVKAESDENVTRRRPDRPAQAEIQEIRQDRREERQENREEVREQVQEIRSNVAENHANRLERRFTFYYSRLLNIISRFEKRLDILKADGKDISTVSAKLTDVKSKLESAKVKGVEAVNAFKAIDPAKFSEQKAEALVARDLANEARKLFVETHTLIKDALKSLKTMSKPALPAASAAVNNTQ